MLTVLFDTNIFHQEGLTSTRIQRFQRLLKESEVKLIIPEIVLEEFRSRRLFLADQEFNNIKKSVNNLQKKEILKNMNIFSGCFYSDSVENIHKQSIDNTSKDIDFWVANDNIEIYKISNTCIDELFKNYFSGNGAFREKRKGKIFLMQ